MRKPSVEVGKMVTCVRQRGSIRLNCKPEISKHINNVQMSLGP